MERRTRKKWIIGAIAVVIMTLAAIVTYNVIGFHRDMEELGQGLNELAEGLSKLNFSSDTTALRDTSAIRADTSNTTIDTLTVGVEKD